MKGNDSGAEATNLFKRTTDKQKKISHIKFISALALSNIVVLISSTFLSSKPESCTTQALPTPQHFKPLKDHIQIRVPIISYIGEVQGDKKIPIFIFDSKNKINIGQGYLLPERISNQDNQNQQLQSRTIEIKNELLSKIGQHLQKDDWFLFAFPYSESLTFQHSTTTQGNNYDISF